MPNLISSPFYFDSEETRAACLTALGLDTVVPESIVENEYGGINLNPSDYNHKVIVSKLDLPSATVFTMVPDADILDGWPENSKITIIQQGTGSVSVEAGVGVTINSAESLTLRQRYSAAQLIWTAPDVWSLVGDLQGATEPVLPIVVDVESQEINTPLDYYSGVALATCDDVTPITNVSVLGGVIEISDNNLFTVPYDYAGAPVEFQIDGISPVKHDHTTDLSITVLKDITVVDALSIKLGVSPFPIGNSAWFKYGVELAYAVGTTYTVKPITNNVVGATVATIDITELCEIRYDTTTNTAQIFADGVGYTSWVLDVNTPWPLYTRGIITDIDSGATFRIDYSAVYNGMGNTLKHRIATPTGAIEITGNDLSPL